MTESSEYVAKKKAPAGTKNRKRAALNYNEDGDDGYGLDEKMGPKRRRSSRKRAGPPLLSYKEDNLEGDVISDDAEGEKDEAICEGDEDDYSENEEFKKNQLLAKQKKRKRNPNPKSDGICPYCQRVFSTASGLQYHVANFVCRQSERPGGPVIKGKRKVSKENIDQSSKRGRKRGTLEERTCQNCGRVFTSLLGKQYHVEKRVCELIGKKKVNNYNLEAGATFVTSYGIVKVVSDNRAFSSVPKLPSKRLAELTKRWSSSMNKRKAQHRRVLNGVSVVSRLRRKKLRVDYENKSINQRTVFQAYFGKVMPNQYIPPDERVTPTPLQPCPPHPGMPAESFPNRLVECVLIPDERVRFRGASGEELTAKAAGSNVLEGTRLYLQRKLLTEGYCKDTPVYSCPRCGQNYSSKGGCQYHMKSNNCTAKLENYKEAANLRTESIEQQAECLFQNSKRPKAAKRRGKINKSIRSVYPEVWLSLGFKLLPRDPSAARKPVSVRSLSGPKGCAVADTVTSSHSVIAEQNSVVKGSKLAEVSSTDKKKITFGASVQTARGGADLEDPRVMILHLQAQLQHEVSIGLGPMYPSVFAVLNFKKPKPEKSKKKKKKKVVNKKNVPLKNNISDNGKRPKNCKEAAADSDLPLPPIIDTRVLVNEVDAGRFPSMKRKTEYKRKLKCNMCRKKIANVRPLACDFCDKFVHFCCLRKRFTVKYPEPGDDFMCNGCISYIQAMRVRAERRRIVKNENTASNGRANRTRNHATQNKDEFLEQEYDRVASLGRNVGELTELLKDAQLRLKQQLAVAEMNCVRRTWIESFESSSNHHA